jgi:hypothetical protein
LHGFPEFFLIAIGGTAWCVVPYIAWQLGTISDDSAFIIALLGYCVTELAFLLYHRILRKRIERMDQNPTEENIR